MALSTPIKDSAPIGLAPLTEDAVASQTDANSFKRGRGYARSHHIFAGVRRGNTLRARCHGSSGGPYLVEATLATVDKPKSKNPVRYACDCPRGGFCKHVVALLLTWIEAPESFDVRPPIADVLASKSREELVALVGLMLSQAPDLEELLELPILVAGTPGAEPVDETAIRRQVSAALRDDGGYDSYGRYDDYYNASSRTAAKLNRIVDLGDAYVAAGDWRNTLRIFAILIEELAPRLTSFYDTDGELSSILARADDALAEALNAQGEVPVDRRLSNEEREWLIDALFTVWQTSIDAGGLDLGEAGEEAIARSASPEEQQRIGERLRQRLKSIPSSPWGTNWEKQAAIAFLSLLSGEAGLSAEELLREYREAELWNEAADLLVRLGRSDEAISLAARHLEAATPLLAFADRLIASNDRGLTARAIALVDDRLWEREGVNVRDDQLLREWLEKRYTEQGKPEKALELARSRFTSLPSKETYDAVKTIARLPTMAAETWPRLQKEMIATLRKRGEWYALIDVYLEEGEIAEALKALERAGKSGRTAWSYGWGISPDQYAVRVAAAAEADFPDAAIQIYQRLAGQLIDQRNRGAYQSAASLLCRVMNVLEANGRAEEWQTFITDLRQRHTRLRALREELDALGLV